MSKQPAGSKQPCRLSVCIVTFKRPEQLELCLARIAPGTQSLDSSLYEVLVSDDCPDGSARSVSDRFPTVTWLQGPGRGIAANRNHVARAAQGDWIVYVDDDELPEPNWLENMHRAAATGQWDVIEGQVVPGDYPDSIFWYCPCIKQGGFFGAGNLGIRKVVLFDLGLFDEHLGNSHEDMDLGRRIRAAGLRTTFLEQAIVLHPARQRTFKQVIRNALLQQRQAYKLDPLSGMPASKWLIRSIYLAPWTIRYLYRCIRIQYALDDRRKWRRFLMDFGIRIGCAPLGLIQILASPGEKDASQKRG